MVMQSGDTDSDEDALWNRPSEENNEDNENKGRPPSVLAKSRPKHNYLMLRGKIKSIRIMNENIQKSNLLIIKMKSQNNGLKFSKSPVSYFHLLHWIFNFQETLKLDLFYRNNKS